jgi:hypothetical protein
MNTSIKLMISAGLFALATSAFACASNSNKPCDPCADPKAAANPEGDVLDDRLIRFYSLEEEIGAAYEGNNLPKATELANEYLRLAADYKCDWNYGNAIHDANRYLGLISLKSGDRAAAAGYLIQAGKSPGSPQLDSFGPELDLANALLQADDAEPVKTYLRDIKTFWETGQGQVDEWLALIEKGEKPNLSRHTFRQGAMDMVFGILTLAWPALVVLGCLYSRRRRILRKWTFLLLGLIVGYATAFLYGLLNAQLLPAILGAVEIDNLHVFMTIVYAAIAGYFLLSFLAVVGLSQFFVSKETAASNA